VPTATVFIAWIVPVAVTVLVMLPFETAVVSIFIAPFELWQDLRAKEPIVINITVDRIGMLVFNFMMIYFLSVC
jgi:hypothetical protein